MIALLLAISVGQAQPSPPRPVGAAELPHTSFEPHRVPVAYLPHGPDNSSGSDVPEGGFKYKKKSKPVLSYVGGTLSAAGLLYLAGSRTAGFEAADAATPALKQAFLDEQASKRTIGLSLLGTAGLCFIGDIFI